jgi:predicted ATP-grasp superfamily ATP-dependent carboligase
MTAQRQAIAIVDPLSTGGTLAAEAIARGYEVIAVWDRDLSEETKAHVPLCARSLRYHGEVDEMATIRETAGAVRAAAGELELVACICGAEAGVYLADALSEELGVRTNGVSAGRRDKKVQQELVRAAGLRSVRQAGGKEWSDVRDFIESEEMPVVVKPTESAGSDGVKLCHTAAEAKEHFQLLMSSQQKVGSQDGAVLCQEFLRGKEYVVDHVSRDGEHKTTMIWVYDKRKANGAAFVYYGMVPVEADSEVALQLIPYVRGVLDALGIKNGASHGEVMMTPTGPCLVEMNCRAHGGDGAWVPLARALTGGYSQVDATVTAFVNEHEFQMLPDRPPSPFLAAGQEVMLVSFQEGKIVNAPGWQKIKSLDSFVSLETSFDIGSNVEPTIDIFGCLGSVILMHQEAEVLKRDVATVREMEISCENFDVESEKDCGFTVSG